MADNNADKEHPSAVEDDMEDVEEDLEEEVEEEMEEVEEEVEIEVEEEVEVEVDEDEEEEGKQEGNANPEGGKGEGEEEKGDKMEEQRADKDANHEGGNPGKIFVGGLSKETTSEMFAKYFEYYGKITDFIVMKDRRSGNPRGFGFVTFADPSVVDKVIEENHVIGGKQVEIKRTIPKGAIPSVKDFKTKRIFVGGIPTAIDEDEFESFFSKYGVIKEHQIMKNHSNNRSRGFGFITFETEEAVDNLLSKGNRVEFAGVQVEIKKAQPKSGNPPPPRSSKPSSKKASYSGSHGGSAGAYGGSSYGAGRAYSEKPGVYGGYGSSSYGGYGGRGSDPYRGDPALAYSNHLSEGGYGVGSYGRAVDSYGGYGGAGAGASGYGSTYDSSLRTGYGSAGGYGGRGGYGRAAARFNPYGR